MAYAQSREAEHAAKTEHTFVKIADELIDKLRHEGKADTTLKKKQWLLDMAIASFGDQPITEITAPVILEALRKVEAKGNYESAKRLRSTIGQVFRYAIATARADTDPTYGLRGALIAPTVRHMAAITDWDAFGHLIRAIWAYEGGSPSTRAALKLMALLYTRPGELRLALDPLLPPELIDVAARSSYTDCAREYVAKYNKRWQDRFGSDTMDSLIS